MKKNTRAHILFGIDESTLAAGVKNVKNALLVELEKQNLTEEISVLETGSLGFFKKGVEFVVYPDNITYVNVQPEDIPEIVEEHLIKGRPVKRLVLSAPEKVQYDFNYKKRIVLANSGVIDPENIEDYLGAGGYEAWEKALLQMNPNQIIDEVKASGLRGRGGAGFPAGVKWSFTAPIDAPQKYVVVNADEGEPGTFKDRLIMEGDPHKLLEGVMICARAVGATKAFIYVRGEYKLCIERLNKAIAQAKEYGVLGENIFESGFDLDIEVMVGAGAYVCGEETALIESMEGKRGNPRSKPPFPGIEGAWQKPTVVNNVETLANVPFIIANGGQAYAKLGPEGSNGTKVFTILGDVEMPGLTEVEMGTTLKSIINEYGGGMKDGKKFKAALIGGSAGVILSEKLLNVKMDYVSLGDQAAVLGSGAILVLSDETPMVDFLASIIHFFAHESCGKCRPCALGTKQLDSLIKKIQKGDGKAEDLDNMIELSRAMQLSSFCALGQSLIMPIKSAIENFQDEFLARIQN